MKKSLLAATLALAGVFTLSSAEVLLEEDFAFVFVLRVFDLEVAFLLFAIILPPFYDLYIQLNISHF